MGTSLDTPYHTKMNAFECEIQLFSDCECDLNAKIKRQYGKKTISKEQIQIIRNSVMSTIHHFLANEDGQRIYDSAQFTRTIIRMVTKKA